MEKLLKVTIETAKSKKYVTEEHLERAKRIFIQKRDDKNKLYSMQAPEVECIAKGKAHKKYEFGCKVSLVSTSKDNWTVGIQALHGNPYDGHTLKDALGQTEELTGWRPGSVYCDKVYKGEPKTIRKTAIHLANRKKKSMKPREWDWLKRRSAIEPITGHTKSNHRMYRNYLKGEEDDRIKPSWPDAVSTSVSSSERSFCGFSKSGSGNLQPP